MRRSLSNTGVHASGTSCERRVLRHDRQRQNKSAPEENAKRRDTVRARTLRFFLSGGDLAATLSEVNPSLAWLPALSELELIQSETQLITWIERNFADVDAVRDVVENIRFFGPETANFLEYRLNVQAANLSPLLAKSWALIIRHMRAGSCAKRVV